MDQPGIEVRPLRQMTGSAEFNEVFFDDARTAKENVLGPVGEGWKVAMATLGFERGTAFLSQQLAFQHELTELLDVARKRGAVDDPVLRDELAEPYVGVQIMQYNGMRMLTSMIQQGRARPRGEHRQAVLDDLAPQLRRDRRWTCSAPTALLVDQAGAGDLRARRRCTESSWRAARRPSTPARARSNATSSVSGCSAFHASPANRRAYNVNFAFSEEQEELRRAVRQFLESKSPETEVRRLMETTEGYDPAVWKQMGQELGCRASRSPRSTAARVSRSSSSASCSRRWAACCCARRTSRRSCSRPARSSRAGTDAEKQALLPGIASGDTIAALAFTEPSGKWDAAGITMEATENVGGEFTLSARRCS